MRPAILHKAFLLLFAALLSMAGMWIYASRVLVPFQMHEAAKHDWPRGTLSDLYPRWLGARELLLHGRDPYSAEVTREIQAGFYGRPLDPSRPDDPHDEEGFAYPVYVVFCLAPTIALPFAIVQRGFFWLMLILTCASTLLWIRVLRRETPMWARISLVALTLGSASVMQGLKLQQMSLLVAGLLAIAITLLATDHLIAAGILLGIASIKPQLVVLLLLWLAIWTLADWRRRNRLAVSFLATMTILVAASEWYLPHWIPRFWWAIHEYMRYTEARSVIDVLVSARWGWLLELLVVAATVGVCWRERRQAANTGAFAFVFSLVLGTTVLIVPSSANYNQVLLIPALLVVVKERRAIWRLSFANRVLFALASVLVVWPWIASIVLDAFSFVLPERTIERVWAVPLWTAIQTPMGVVALMLVHYYQKTFTAPPKSGTS